jgi:uncharacterized protein (DUF427 family)
MTYPPTLPIVNHTAPVPRRIRGFVGGRAVFDTTRARYVWEWPHYPQYYIPRAAVDESLLEAAGVPHQIPQGISQDHALRVGDDVRAHAAKLFTESPLEGVANAFRFRWSALDHWFEEDEEIFVHPRDPYTRVDALRSRRRVRVELDGAVLAESPSPVAVFETGLPTRWYFDPSDVRFEFLRASETRTECPYKGRTTSYWSVAIGERTYADIAWSYAFPTGALLPIAGLVAFLDENVDVFIDGVAQARPITHMS